MEPTSIGDTVNLASRVESLSKVYGAKILITQFTLERLGDDADSFLIRELDYVAVKGKEKPVKIYEVVDGESIENFAKKSRLMAPFRLGLDHFAAGKFTHALGEFEKCLSIHEGDLASRLYRDRCNELLSDSSFDPSKWDGIYKLDYK